MIKHKVGKTTYIISLTLNLQTVHHFACKQLYETAPVQKKSLLGLTGFVAQHVITMLFPIWDRHPIQKCQFQFWLLYF